MSDDNVREYDIVLYGATGFVGRLTSSYLAKAAPPGARIALAGRRRSAVEALRGELAAAHPVAGGWGILIADADDELALEAMAAATEVVISTVGPFAEHGLALVVACARNGTDYADVTGEVLFVRDSIDAAHDIAVSTGARIVHACGFDSIPSDITTYLLHREVQRVRGDELTNVTLVVRDLRGGFSGGTVASGRASRVRVRRSSKDAELAKDPYTLTPDRRAEPDLGAQTDHRVYPAHDIHPALEGWAAPFIMAPFNTRVVRRSNALASYAYGRNFEYSEVLVQGRHRIQACAYSAALSLIDLSLLVLPRRVLGWVMPKPGRGPSERARRRGGYALETHAQSSSGRTYVARMSQEGDPGYNATSVLLGEAAMCLAFDRTELATRGGVMTPAYAMGKPLSRRLTSAPGVRLAVSRN